MPGEPGYVLMDRRVTLSDEVYVDVDVDVYARFRRRSLYARRKLVRVSRRVKEKYTAIVSMCLKPAAAAAAVSSSFCSNYTRVIIHASWSPPLLVRADLVGNFILLHTHDRGTSPTDRHDRKDSVRIYEYPTRKSR